MAITERLLKEFTWLKAGGLAKMLKVNSIETLRSFFLNNQINIMILGAGSNLLIRDGGLEEVVIKLGREFNYVRVEGTKIHAGGAALVKTLAQIAAKANLKGFEFLVGIPGTVGGALAMNAGAFGSEISQILESALLMDSKGQLIKMETLDINYKYRQNSLPKEWVFLEGTFNGIPEKYEIISKKMQENIELRDFTQPTKVKTCGSIFKNPLGNKAWKLIEASKARGLKVGGAVISELHCNFLINEGNASAQDMEDLCNLVRQKVKECTGVHLEFELVIIGKPLNK